MLAHSNWPSKALYLIALCGLVCLTGCERSKTSQAPIEKKASTVNAANTEPQVTVNYDELYRSLGKNGLLSLQKSLSSAQALSSQINTFLTHSTEANWQQLQQQWRLSHQQWHHSDSYLQMLNPSHELNSLRLKLHSSEVTPGYLDSVEGYPHSGIVNDSTLPLNRQTIAEQHRRYSDEETSLGIHVLEYFLWARQAQDYQKDLPKTTNTVRRAQFVSLVAQQWQSDIELALSYWQQQTEAPLAPAALQLQLQQMLGSLSNDLHCQFSEDQLWRQAVVAAIGPLVEQNEDFKRLQSQLQSQQQLQLQSQSQRQPQKLSEPTDTRVSEPLQKNLGAAILSLRLKAF